MLKSTSRFMHVILMIIASLIIGMVLTFGINYVIGLVDQVWLQYVLHGLWNIIIFIVIISILFRSDDSYNKLPWLLFIVLWPEAAIIFYFSFARDFAHSTRYKNRPLMHDNKYITYDSTTDFSSLDFRNIDDEANEIFKFTHELTNQKVFAHNTKTTILNNGEEKFDALIKRLKGAKKYIFMEYYILKTDQIGKEVLDILVDKVKAGLEVRLMYDYFGGRSADRKYIKYLKDSGIIVEVFDPVKMFLLNTKINYRLHRKITVIDGEVAFTGGLNLGDEYIHRSPKFGFWRDTHIMVEGEGVKALLSILLKDWYYVTGDLISDPKYYETKPVKCRGYVTAIESGPDSKIPNISSTYIKMISQAKKSIKIVTPYIAPSRELSSAIKIASLSGIDVTIIIPGLPDKKLVYGITMSYLKNLLDAGVHIKKYKDHFVHSKVMIIDDKIACVGTFNLDNRSERLNFEDTVIFHNESVLDVVRYFDEDIKVSEDYTIDDYNKLSSIKKIIYALVNLVAPLA